MRRIVFVVALQLVVASCGSAPAPADGLGFRNRMVLTLEEIQASHTSGSSAYDLIAQLRPEFLRSRGSSSLRRTETPKAVVYVDAMRYGDIGSLRTVSAAQIQYIQYLSALDATTRFGTNHFGGAILISTK